MASAESPSISLHDVYNAQLNELKEMKTDLDKQKNELSTTLTKYDQHLSQYTIKLEQLHLLAEKTREQQEENESNLSNATKEWLDIKTKLESSAVSPNHKVKLNVGGDYFETTIDTLTKYNEGTTSYFKALFSRQWQLEKDPKDESIFIDRDGCLFGYILQYFRTGKMAIDPDCDILRRDLIIEAQFYNLNTVVDLLRMIEKTKGSNTKPDQSDVPKQLYLNTKILSLTDQIELNKLNGCVGQQWQMIYRASRDGYTDKAFHQLCDGCFPTMCIIRSKNGFIFGGFTSVPWSSSNQDRTDTCAFLFTLKNPHGIKPTKYPICEGSVRFAVGHYAKGGPTFGSVENGALDLFLDSPFNGNCNRTFFPRTYQDTTKKARLTFTGDPYFSCDDVEIFTPM